MTVTLPKECPPGLVKVGGNCLFAISLAHSALSHLSKNSGKGNILSGVEDLRKNSLFSLDLAITSRPEAVLSSPTGDS